MNKRLLFFFTCLLFTISLVSQSLTVPKRGLKRITSDELFKTMSVLTSDSLEGRATGEVGGVKAAAYIEDKFREIGLSPYFDDGYRQEFMLYGKKYKEVELTVKGQLISGDDAVFYLGNRSVDVRVEKELVFIGNANDTILASSDLVDKLVLVNLNQLTRSYAIINKLESKGVWGIIGFSGGDTTQFNKAVSFNTRMRKMVGLNPKKPVETDAGVRLYIINNNQLPTLTGFSAEELVAKQICSDSLIIMPVTIESSILVNEVPTWNIIGVIKGLNAQNKPIAVTAHYDHVGRQASGICCGADDNASGVSSIMQVAVAYSGLKEKPVRDIIFIAFGAEEIGLIGSEYFMNNYDRDDFFANINIDMIGRRDTLTKENYIYILGTEKNPITQSLHKEANRQTVNLNLDYSYGKDSGFGNMMNRSDHYHFFKKGIPVITFFSGLHGDYHTPLDTIDKIDFPLMTRRVQLVFGTLYLLVNTESLGD